ncbi:RagB/SusD domain-containing protein [Mucilaginibacter paludis DSM 18603]|uniref:RagB/SusD domain-containing protein n=2 Tax=Mucilaginibacter TaxID=423349 RepID=H1Y9V9_9SPHI|nr:RagB/SusD domain-containing protein [Mucilaginibacter paludis DSM 18603]
MIKNSTYKILLLVTVLVAGVSSSCNKWLNIKPQDGLVNQDYWKTKEQLAAAVTGCYASMLDGAALPLTKYMFIWGELRGDMVVAGTEPAAGTSTATLSTLTRDELDMLHTDIVATNTLNNWDAFYEIINYCNNVIKYGPGVKTNDNTLTQAALNAYIGEARGLRGLMYFYLLRTFGEVPLKLEPTSSDADIQPLAKSTRAQVAAQIIDDLKFAAANVLVSYGNIGDDKGRINQYTAYTILADVYLWTEDYQNCIDACNKVIQSNNYQLFPAGTLQADWYNSVFFNGNSVEGIFELQFYAQKLNPFFNMFAATGREFKAADWVATGDLFGTDIVDATNKDIRGAGVSMSEGSGGITKYTQFATTATSYSHWFLYRYSDVLLMKAEALTWLTPGNVANATAAIAIVDQVRLARHALSNVNGTTISDPDPNITLDVSNYIFNERAREFAYEGKRWFDILRNAKRNNYANIIILLNIVSSSAPADKQQSVINKYKDIRSHYLPIYSYEIQTNNLLVQNPFYQ